MISYVCPVINHTCKIIHCIFFKYGNRLEKYIWVSHFLLFSKTCAVHTRDLSAGEKNAHTNCKIVFSTKITQFQVDAFSVQKSTVSVLYVTKMYSRVKFLFISFVGK